LATATANILHVWVDNLSQTPERLFGRSYDSGYFFLHATGMLSGAVAAIIVSYPIFAWLAVYLKKQRDTKIFVRNLRSRKILIYITLVGTFLIMIGHVIATIYNFLSGSGTGNTIGHLLITLIVAGVIFWYFISEVKNDSKN
jgi:vacuolar-type H+-ATPase subunit I/STV1